MELQLFHVYVGKLMMYCQCIEHDIKWIYAKMLKGDYVENFHVVSRNTLGEVVKELKNLDYSEGHQWLEKEDYKLLHEITGIRNYWAHQAYVDFVYDGTNTDKYKEISKKLEVDKKRLERIQLNIEKFRVATYK